jgi:hypothetical protein
MPRRARSILGGYPYHVLNRANGRLRLFRKEADFAAFERVVEEAFARVPLRAGRKRLRNKWACNTPSVQEAALRKSLPKLTDAWLNAIVQLPKLNTLDISRNRKITAAGVTSLMDHPTLRHLSVTDCLLHGSVLDELRNSFDLYTSKSDEAEKL